MPALSASGIGPAAAALMASELMARGRKSAAALEALLQLDASTTTTAAAPGQQDHGIRDLAEQILCCFDRALAALHGDDGGVDDREATGFCCPSKKRRSAPPGAAAALARPKRRSSRGIGAEMPTRVEKRSTPDDGFLWRKYGQKDILNSKYPRTYFRCTYKYDNNGCRATRQVQQSEDDPASVYIVTYFGDHTCGMDAGAATATVGENEKSSPQLVISFGSGTTTTNGSPWVSSSVEDGVGSNSSVFSEAVCLPEEDDVGEQKANNACNIESSVLLPPAAAPSSSADDVSCVSPDDLDSLLHYFDWDDYCGLSLLPCSIWNS